MKVCRLLAGLVLVLCLMILPARADDPFFEVRRWTLTQDEETRVLTASFRSLREDRVVLLEEVEDGPPVEHDVAFVDLSQADRQAVLAIEDTDQPRRSPDWMDGYRVRYPMYIVDDLLTAPSRSIVARIPTGGWVREDAADIVAQGADGTRLPVAILAHDEHGDTLIQFRRQGFERWYWVYAVHPQPPRLDDGLQRRIDQTRQASQAAVQSQMELQKSVGELAGRLRDVEDTIARAQQSADRAEAEIKQWADLLPERQTEAQAAEAKVAPLEAPVRDAEPVAVAAREAAQAAVAAQRAAEARAAAALAEVEKEPEADQPAAQLAADAAQAEAQQAGETALRARMDAAAADTALEAARRSLGEAQQAHQRAQRALQDGRNAEQAARRLKTEQTAIAQENTAPRDRLRQELETAQTAAAAAVETADRLQADYFEAAADADPSLLREGLSAEFRDWEGDELSSWPAVVEGLNRSDNVLGNAFPSEIRMNVNPARRHDPRNFAASYRGYLTVEVPGVYSFFANADDASFIFINGFLVHARPGSNPPLTGRAAVFNIGADIALEAGVHPIEVHHVVGNSPSAIGFCGLMWIPPGERRWQYVPRQAFAGALTAVASGVEHGDGAPLAVIQHGLHDSLISDGVAMYPVRFTAAGSLPENASVRWDFGDGLSATGQVAEHVYFMPGDYTVTLRVGDSMPPFTRRINVWSTPVPTSSRTLERTVSVLAEMDFEELPVDRLNQVFNFLRLSEQAHRWPPLERVCRRLLRESQLDVEHRTRLHTVLMEAMARQGRAREALERMDQALSEAAGLRALEAEVLLQAADVQRIHLRDYREADALYSRILDEYSRLRHPVIRRAAVAWGDMFLQAGDPARAAETYRLAAGLGDATAGESAGDAAGRGALLRIAEQQLRAGDLSHADRLLQRIEASYPEQKVEGLYRFLRAETGRLAGRYEDAIYDYEVVLQLTAWAGYHGPAMIGLADTYRRMHDHGRALEWLDAVRERYPALYEDRELETTRALIEARRENLQDGDQDPLFTGFRSVFDPDVDGEQARFTTAQRVRLVRAPALDGEQAAYLFAGDQRRNLTWRTVLPNVEPESRFWIEFWIRNEFTSPRAVVTAHVHIDIIGPGNQRFSRESVALHPTFGQWQKVGALLKGPVADEISVALNFGHLTGLVNLDAIDISVVTDSEYDALRRFVDGEGDGS